MSDDHVLIPMDAGEPEAFRCRIYGAAEDSEDEAKRRAFAGPGVIDCPAIDPWTAALQARGWLPAQPELEANPDGPGKIGRWRLTSKGREGWEKIALERDNS